MFQGRKVGLLVAVVLFASTSWSAQREPEAVPGEYVIKVNKTVLRSMVGSLASLKSQLRAEEIRVASKRQGVFVVKRSPLERSEIVLADLRRHSAIQIAEPNFIYKISAAPNDPMLGDLWGMANTGKNNGVPGIDIGALEAWNIATGSRDIIVGVIDTGIDYTHADLKDNMWTNDAELNGKKGVDDDKNGYVDDIYGYDFANEDADPMDDHGHGSHVSGTIGGKGNDGKGIVGVNWNVRLMGLKFLTAQGSGTLEGAVKAIEYAAKMGAHLTNNSWGGGGFSQALYDGIEEAMKKGQLFIAAAGNDSSDNDANPMYPSSYELENIISVAAINNKGELAYFSNYGKKSVDVAAPGEAITSSTPGGYDTWNGTSMATPHVSGIVALLMSHERDLTWQQVRERIILTAKPLAGIKAKTASGGLASAHTTLINQQPPPDPNDPSNWKNKSLNKSSEHPYASNTNQEWVISQEGAKRISVYFEKFETESGYDKVTFLDASGNEVGVWSGKHDGEYSPFVTGDKMTIRLTSDQSVNKHGFDITKLAFEN